jgi:hypothetical protein
MVVKDGNIGYERASRCLSAAVRTDMLKRYRHDCIIKL